MTENNRELFDLVWALKAEVNALKDLIYRLNPGLAQTHVQPPDKLGFPEHEQPSSHTFNGEMLGSRGLE